MTASLRLPKRPSRRWWLAVTAAVTAQLALLWWFGDARPVQPRRADHEPRFWLVPALDKAVAELLNPTLFPWSGPHGFSGPAWLGITPPRHQPFEWTEPPRWLTLDPQTLTGLPAAPAPLPSARLDLLPGGVTEVRAPFDALAENRLPTRSCVVVRGELAGRPLRSGLAPPAQPFNDLLPDTEVRVVVDAAGRVQSATTLSRSGLPAADATALDLARTARFAPLARDEIPALQTGTLVFRWHTVPAPEPPPARP